MGTNELPSSRTDRQHAAPFLGMSVALQMTLAVAANPVAAAPARTSLNEVASWGYQLQHVDRELVAASHYDLMVIDFSQDGSAGTAFTWAEVQAMRRKPDGSSRIVLAYLSIGEAEDYRSYWQDSWAASPPDWLGQENPDWPGNYAVRFWDTHWQSVIMGSPDAYLDRIVAAGFDGVYLDRIDAFDVDHPSLPRATRMQRMAEFVSAIAAYARGFEPGFFVMGQNGEELLDNTAYAAAIEGVGKEDLFFGIDGDDAMNSTGELRASLGPLQRFKASGKPVFLVEYVSTPDAMARVRKNAAVLGFPLFIGNRELDDVRSR
ncbi:MJ1477/TM1410 family putative glycoside hydrolase [Devosia ureilytica]|uniref:MJ1477/TM1410 family putative glycoside hydrolase n=2 Tax=Devosia ureilytica TaxID=2952754 RepID=UPI0020C802F1|nr:MJ1477/TM1410 family putative glycoside hydrolase [Devosia ureilytica]